MRLSEYEKKRELYEDFSKVVNEILHTVISQEDSQGGYKYHLQHIQYRAKSYDSLARRLAEKGLTNSEHIEKKRNDLAGCRVIFYYDSDVNQLSNSRIIHDNFIVLSASKIHGPGPSPQSTNDYYTAKHFVVELNDSRSQLTEYSRFKGLKCEIQVCTTLNHAWAEIAHYMTYKVDRDESFGKHIHEGIDNRLMNIMENHFIPVSYEIQKLQNDYEILRKGKELLNCELGKEIRISDNNRRCDILEQYYEYTLQLYDGACLQNELKNIFKLVNDAIFLAKDEPVVDINTSFGLMKGRTYKHVLNISLKIINYIRFMDVKLTFKYLISLYQLLEEKDDRKLIKDSIVALVQYDINILRKYGFFVQNVIVECLEKIDITNNSWCVEILVEVAKLIFSSLMQSISANYKECVIKRGSIPGGKTLENFRNRILTLLFNSINYKNNITCDAIRSALNAATQLPSLAGYSDELLALILHDCLDVINFHIKIMPNENYENLQLMEADVLNIYWNAIGMLNSPAITDELCLSYCKKIKTDAIEFRDQLNRDYKYMVYKTLIGFNSVFDESWSDKHWRYHKQDEYRQSKLESYVNEFLDSNSEYWDSIIVECANAGSRDRLTFPMLRIFLELMAEKHPQFIFNLISSHEDSLMRYSNAVLCGLLKSSLNKDVIIHMHQWINQGRYLLHCSSVFQWFQPCKEDILVKILIKSIDCNDVDALNNLVIVSLKNSSVSNKGLIDSLFLSAIQHLTKLKSSNWIFYNINFNDVPLVLSRDELKELLANMVPLDEIGFDAEEILSPIADKYPDLILDFFHLREKFIEAQNNTAGRFEVVPFNFDRLSDVLSKHVDLVVDSICTWYKDNPEWFHFRGARLITNIFPNFSQELENKLTSLVQEVCSDTNFSLSPTGLQLSYLACIWHV